jgi:hypothetical protein
MASLQADSYQGDGLSSADVGTWCHSVWMAQSPPAVPALPLAQSQEITVVTRRDIFDFLRARMEPWWGRLDEVGFLDRLYDLGGLPSTDSRHATAAEDIIRHRIANLDWDDDWVFDDPRFRLADGPDKVLLDFLAQMAHPLVDPDTDRAAQLVGALNPLLAPDGWELQTAEFMSGRPVYAGSRNRSGVGRMIRLEISDSDAGKLEIALGQAYHLLGENQDALAQELILEATLSLRPDGGYFHPTPGDNWTDATYEAVLTVDSRLTLEFTDDMIERIWAPLGSALAHHGRKDVRSLVVEQTAALPPAVTVAWRKEAAQLLKRPPSNQARREREAGGYPSEDELVFGSQAELAVYRVLVEIQREFQIQKAIAILPLPGAKLRDAGVLTPDLVVLGNGRAAIIEVDGPHHYGRTRKADNVNRDRHWVRCGVEVIRLTGEQADDPVSLKALLLEDLRRVLGRS